MPSSPRLAGEYKTARKGASSCIRFLLIDQVPKPLWSRLTERVVQRSTQLPDGVTRKRLVDVSSSKGENVTKTLQDTETPTYIPLNLPYEYL